MNIRNQLAFGGKTIPSKSDALVWLDGTISGDSFVDKISGRLFPITNKDFPTGWTKGFPYKSAATFSAPAGDAALIAADVNGFFYTAGVPNQIPVVSCFQDVDYAHRLFFRHIGQSIDIDTYVETYEPRVTEMVLYASVANGSDLTTKNSYFKVSAEITTNVKWVDVANGLDTNQGTKSSPYLTLSAAHTALTTGTIYIKTGKLTANTAGVILSKDIDVIGTGYVDMQMSTYAFYVRSNLPTIKGIKARSQYFALLDNNVGLTASKINAVCTTKVISQASSTSSACSLTDCVISLSAGASYVFDSAHTTNIMTGCKVNATCSALVKNGVNACINRFKYNDITLNGSFYGAAASTNTLGDFEFFNNRLNQNNGTSAMFLETNASFASNFVFKYNDVKNVGYTKLLNSRTSIDVQFNKITSKSIVASSIFYFIHDNTTTGRLYFRNNIMLGVGTSTSCLSHSAVGGGIPSEIESNYFHWDSTSTGVGVSIGFGINDIDGLVGYYRNNMMLCDNPSDHNVHGSQNYDQPRMHIYNNYYDAMQRAPILKASNANWASTRMDHNVVVGGVILVKGGDNAKVYNNTCASIKIMVNDGNYPANNADFKNNIILGNIVDANPDYTSYTSDYNIIKGDVNGEVADVLGTTYTLSQWQALGYDTHSLVPTSQQLLDMFNANSYSLKSGSIAIGTGTNLGELYNTGLDASTNWGSDTQLPSVVTKQQPALWDCGAYIH